MPRARRTKMRWSPPTEKVVNSRFKVGNTVLYRGIKHSVKIVDEGDNGEILLAIENSRGGFLIVEETEVN